MKRVEIVTELVERVKYRQSLLNRLNRAYSANPAKIVRKETFQICRYLKLIFF